MKKITLLFVLLASIFASAQTYTTGMQTFIGSPTFGYSGKVDITATTVTITMVGPEQRWMCMGFTSSAVSGMSNGDIVSFSDQGLVDRSLEGIGEFPADAVQNWTLASNTVAGGVRTVTATRVLNTGEANDYIFSAATGSMNLMYSRASSGTMSLQPHGGLSNAGNKAVNVTLGMEGFDLESFKMYPNPAKTYTTIELPANVESGVVKIYDALGRVVRRQEISKTQNNIATEGLSTGSYMVVLRTDYGNATKTLLVN